MMKFVQVEDRQLVIRVPLPRAPRRLSLRALVILFTAVCLLLGYLNGRARRARQQHEAVTHVWQAGGSVCYTGSVHYRMYEDGKITWASHEKAGYPKELIWRTHLGTDFFDTVTSVTIGPRSKTPVTESSAAVRALFSKLEFLPSVESICIRDIAIDDIDIEAIRKCRKLKRVYATGNHSSEQVASLLRLELPHCNVSQ